MRMLVANELRAYREAIAGAVQALRPHLEVIAVEPEDLDRDVAHLMPQLVLCSELTEVVETRCLAWVVLYPNGETRAVVNIAGHRRTVAGDLPFARLLSIVDEAERLAS
jgi:hypothetical protein